LTTGARQQAVEGEPVGRHTSDFIDVTDKDVYCLFIAPGIDTKYS
jgi:hypothetical protein